MKQAKDLLQPICEALDSSGFSMAMSLGLGCDDGELVEVSTFFGVETQISRLVDFMPAALASDLMIRAQEAKKPGLKVVDGGC